MRTIITIKTIFILIAFLGENAFACRLSYQGNKKFTQFTITSSPKEGRARSYTEGEGRNVNNQYVLVNSCMNGSSISISRGLELSKFEFPSRDVLAEERMYNPQMCEISNYPLNGNASFDRSIQLSQKFKVVNDCLQYRITSDIDTIAALSSELGVQLDREGKQSCIFTKIDNETILVNPENIGLCMIPMQQKYQLKVSFEMNPVCNSLNYFSQNNIELQEIRTSVRFDKLETLDGNAGKESMGTIQGVMHFNPDLQDNSSIANIPMTNITTRKQLEPRFLAVWPLEISLSRIQLQNVEYEENGVQKREAMIQSVFLVDNRCESFCKNGLCTSPCNYSQPAYAAAAMYKINKSGSRQKVARQWYTGGSATPQWVGNIGGSFYRLNRNLEIGQVYEVEYQFRDPRRNAFRYLEFLKSFGDYYVDPTDFIFNGDINDLAELPEFSGVEEFESLAELEEDLDTQIMNDLSYGEKRFFPPMYKERWLGERESRPVNLNIAKDRSNIILKLRFKITGIQGNQYIFENAKQTISSTTSLESTCSKLSGVLSAESAHSGKRIDTCVADFKEVRASCN